ncbi:hypothetical protein PENTCL1PPCAC_3727, partial [Pristionchus entomophagus]
KNVWSWRSCVGICRTEAMCVSAAYSDKLHICHLHTPTAIGFPQCAVTPFRRFVKTMDNCKEWVTYDRTNLSREMGGDPCYPDNSNLHFDLVKLDGVERTCPIRKLDGSNGPLLFFR